jgi:hypothetical protein
MVSGFRAAAGRAADAARASRKKARKSIERSESARDRVGEKEKRLIISFLLPFHPPPTPQLINMSGRGKGKSGGAKKSVTKSSKAGEMVVWSRGGGGARGR